MERLVCVKNGSVTRKWQVNTASNSWAKLACLLQVSITMPWMSTHHHQTRCFAHLVVHSLVTAHPELFTSPEASSSYASQLLQDLLTFTAQNPSAQRLLEVCPLSLDTDFARLSHPSCLLQGRSVLVGLCDSEPVECATVSVIEQMGAFLEAERKTLRQQDSKVPERTSNGCATPNPLGANTTGASESSNQGGSNQAGQGQGYQRKVEPWGAMGGVQAHSAYASMQEDELLLQLIGCALDFGGGDEFLGVQAPAQSMRGELLSETGAFSKNFYAARIECMPLFLP